MASESSSPHLAELVDAPSRNSQHKVKDTAAEHLASPEPGTDESEPAQEGKTLWSKPRRFLPQPVEESSRSNHRRTAGDEGRPTAAQPQMPSTSESQVVESTSETSPVAFQQLHCSSIRRFAPEPVESTTRSSRRKFVPQPVETTSRSSRDKDKEATSSKPKRRFAPEPVETTSRSSKDGQQDSEKVRRKFKAEPISTERHSFKRKAHQSEAEDKVDGDRKPDISADRSSGRGADAVRKFSPELIETAKGSYRQSVVSSPTKAEQTSVTEECDELPPLEESKFSAAALAKKQNEQQRKPSFMIPELPMIESDSGDDSEAPSLTNSRSSAESERRSHLQQKSAAGDSYTDYVLQLAAQSATEKELEEQAMAAYVNERPHERVAHFAYDDEDEGPIRVGKFSGEKGVDVRTFRRSSQDDLDLEMQNMRKHHAQLEAAKRELKHDTAGQSRFSAAALATRHHIQQKQQNERLKQMHGQREDAEREHMRKTASPPMLGGDLVFPYTISPKMTRCDVDHPPRPRTNDSDDEEKEIDDNLQLWNAKVNVNNDSPQGLWMGLCQQQQDGNASKSRTPLRSGLQTPAVEQSDPFDTMTPGRNTPKNKPPARARLQVDTLQLTVSKKPDTGDDSFTSTLDAKLELERQIDLEFPDSVISQLYNYLSLGYPSLAWFFDEELSKISRIPVQELRKDDERADAKGYVGAPESERGTEEGEVKTNCRRWEALRFYVREWARQSPNFMDQGRKEARGVRVFGGNAGVRKGSWGH